MEWSQIEWSGVEWSYRIKELGYLRVVRSGYIGGADASTYVEVDVEVGIPSSAGWFDISYFTVVLFFRIF